MFIVNITWHSYYNVDSSTLRFGIEFFLNLVLPYQDAICIRKVSAMVTRDWSGIEKTHTSTRFIPQSSLLQFLDLWCLQHHTFIPKPERFSYAPTYALTPWVTSSVLEIKGNCFVGILMKVLSLLSLLSLHCSSKDQNLYPYLRQLICFMLIN